MDDRASFLMFFCALLLVKHSKATLEQSLMAVPLAGKASSLAGFLCR